MATKFNPNYLGSEIFRKRLRNKTTLRKGLAWRHSQSQTLQTDLFYYLKHL